MATLCVAVLLSLSTLAAAINASVAGYPVDVWAAVDFLHECERDAELQH